MKTVLLFLLFFAANQIYTQAQDTVKIKSIATDVVNLLQNNQAEKVYALFDAKMQDAMKPNNLSSIWKGIADKYGALKGVKDIWVEEVPAYKIVVQACQFGETLMDFRLTFDEQGKIAGMFFSPPGKKKE